MSTRKLRSDAGTRRKSAPTEIEIWRAQFVAMSPEVQRFELGYLTAVMEIHYKAVARDPEPVETSSALIPPMEER